MGACCVNFKAQVQEMVNMFYKTSIIFLTKDYLKVLNYIRLQQDTIHHALKEEQVTESSKSGRQEGQTRLFIISYSKFQFSSKFERGQG